MIGLPHKNKERRYGLIFTEVRNEARRVVYETMIVVREQLNEALGCHIRIGDFKFLITAIMDKLNKGITGNSSETRKNSPRNFKTAHYQFFLTFLIFLVYEHPGNSGRDVLVPIFPAVPAGPSPKPFRI